MSSTPVFPNDRTAEPGKDPLDRVTDTAAQLTSQASELGRDAIERLDAGRAALAGGLERAADAIRTNVPDTGGYARTAANALGSAAGYIRSRDIREMGSDLTVAVRRNPRASLIAAASIGFLLGVMTRRSD